MSPESLPTGVARGFLGMPKLPLPGFFLRLLAFLVDMFLIIGAIHLVSRNFPNLFFALGRWSPYLTGTFMFLYFVLFNSIWGKGQTIGKTILQIRTTDYDGGVPTVRQAVIRTVTLFPVFVTVPLVESFWGSPRTPYEGYAQFIVTGFLLLSVLIATLLVIPFNPFKQGIHDFLAETLVQKKAEPVTFDILREMTGSGWKPFHRQPQYSGFVTVALMLVFLSIAMYPANVGPALLRYHSAIADQNHLPGFEGSELSLQPIPLSLYQMSPEDSVTDLLRAEATSTSPTVELVVEVWRPDEWRIDPATPEGRAAADRYLRKYHENAFPNLLEAYRTAPGEEEKQNAPEADGESESNQRSLLRQRADRWGSRPVVYHLKMGRQIKLTPHPERLEKVIYEHSAEFPPVTKP